MKIFKNGEKKFLIEMTVSELASFLEDQSYCINQAKKQQKKNKEFIFAELSSIDKIQTFNQFLRKLIY